MAFFKKGCRQQTQYAYMTVNIANISATQIDKTCRAVLIATMILTFTLPSASVAQRAAEFDIVLANGRVMDPESNLDAVRFLGIRNGKIAAISTRPLRGRTTIDIKGLVVAPGFIDLHSHGQDDENYRYKARDGVTTALEMEVGRKKGSS